VVETLTIDLFQPGMGPLHRAGLGGLAATIRWINDRVPPDRRPPGRLAYDARRVELSWDSPEGAAGFFSALYGLAFGVEGGLIHLPGSYGGLGPGPEVKAALQLGMARTILQFGPNRKADGPPVSRAYEVDGQPLTIQHQNLIGYTHMAAWEDLVTARGLLKARVPISGTIAPGFVQRHVAYPATTIEQPPGPAIALHFALVGTLALAVGRTTGALLIPDVDDLERFARLRGVLTPREARECRIASPADAALQACLRLRKAELGEALGLRRCLAVLFATQGWNEKQKGRAAVVDVEPDPATLDRFDVALQRLPPRVVTPARPTRKGGVPEPFWADSVVRPLVAENLARGLPWFRDFRRLVVATDGSTDEEKVRQLGYETKGLHAMIDEPWSDRGEEVLVRAVHEAMRQHFGRIWEESGQNKTTYENRRDRQLQRWRLAFAGSKTADEVRNGLADMWSRAGQVPALRESWRDLLPLLCDEGRWRLNRDLALLALASYQGAPRSAQSNATAGATAAVDDEA